MTSVAGIQHKIIILSCLLARTFTLPQSQQFKMQYYDAMNEDYGKFTYNAIKIFKVLCAESCVLFLM